MCSVQFFVTLVCCTILNVFCGIVCHDSASDIVLDVFCRLVVTFEFRALFFMCSVAFLSL